MTGTGGARSDGEARESLERLMDERPQPTPEVAAALDEVRAARRATSEALDELTAATQAALDVPAKIRRNPGRTAALVGGAGFLLAGGPRRVARFVGRRVRPPRRRDPYEGLLPPEIEKVLKDTGLAKDPDVRRALERDFAEYLRRKGRYEAEPSASASFWRTFDRVAGPLGTAGARVLVQRLMEAEHTRSEARREAWQRRRARGAPGGPGADREAHDAGADGTRAAP